MKKNLLILCAVGALATQPRIAAAQTTATNKPARESVAFTSFPGDTLSTVNSGPILINNVNIKAVRDFTRSYKNATQVKWVVLDDGFLAHCYYDSIQTRIVYDNRGNRVCVFRSYGESKLPRDIRHVVKSQYYDYNIFCVTELTNRNGTIYFIKIEDASQWKTLRVGDGDITCTEEFTKG